MVGIGPGGKEDRTPRAEAAIAVSSVIAGYNLYLKHIADITEGKELIASGMKKESERCEAALESTAAGNVVSLVSSGDPGVYGMAGLALEMADAKGLDIEIEIVPGISAAGAAASRLGAPLMLDYAVISLSDLLVEWDVILKRLKAVAEADMAVALYNPKSRKRVTQIEEAAAIFRATRPATTPVGICTAVGGPEEKIEISDLGSFLDCDINMRSIVIIGNSTTKMVGGKIVTPRGYEL